MAMTQHEDVMQIILELESRGIKVGNMLELHLRKLSDKLNKMELELKEKTPVVNNTFMIEGRQASKEEVAKAVMRMVNEQCLKR